MKVTCISDTAKNTSKMPENGTYQQKTTKEPLIRIGKTYTAYSIIIWDGHIEYLLDPLQDSLAIWYSAELFEVADPSIPEIWFFSFKGYNPDYPLYAIFGYKEMVFDTMKHNGELLEREPEAIAIFQKRRDEINNYEQIKSIIIGKTGQITHGFKTGWNITIKNSDDDENSGYTIELSKGDESFVEDWVKNKEELRQIFVKNSWEVSWGIES